jgi:phosphohistidine swiveling domain-containing protein
MTTTSGVERRFPSPFSLATPAGAEGWERIYPAYLLFSEENREWEDASFWFLDSLHRPEVEYPFDTIVHEAWNVALSVFSSRVFAVPGARGIVNRILNGRLYSSTVPVEDPAEIEQRVPIFMRRAGHYYEHWDELFAQWRSKMEAAIDEIMVCPITAPSWGPVSGKIRATVSDMGGVMCHAAIVSREYGLPAVVGTGRGTKVIQTGDRIRVDGDSGVVTVLR